MSKWKSIMLAGALCVVSSAAYAEDVKLSKTNALPVDIDGFIDVAVAGNATSRSSSFDLSEFELDIKKSFEGIASFRVDLNFLVADARDINGNLVAPNFDQLFEQFFVTVDLLKKKTGLSLTVGKFNAPIGFEALDPPNRFQLSLSNVFSLLLPFNVLGGMINGEWGPVSLAVHVTKGWDKLTDNNNSATFGGRLGFSLAGGKLGFGLSAMWGPEGPQDGDPRTVIDFDLTYNPIPKLTVGFEANFGTQPKGSGITPGTRASWGGLLTTIHYRWKEWLGTTLRYDMVYDPDGAMADAGVAQTRHSLTAAALFFLHRSKGPFSVSNGAMAGVEYRADISGAGVFTGENGTTSTQRHVIAAKLLYAW